MSQLSPVALQNISAEISREIFKHYSALNCPECQYKELGCHVDTLFEYIDNPFGVENSDNLYCSAQRDIVLEILKKANTRAEKER